jgi:hypothetical protein
MPSILRFAAMALMLASPVAAWGQGALAPVPEHPPASRPDTRIPERLAPADDRSGGDVQLPGLVGPGSNPDPGISVTPPQIDYGRTRVIPPPGTLGGSPGAQPR